MAKTATYRPGDIIERLERSGDLETFRIISIDADMKGLKMGWIGTKRHGKNYTQLAPLYFHGKGERKK